MNVPMPVVQIFLVVIPVCTVVLLFLNNVQTESHAVHQGSARH